LKKLIVVLISTILFAANALAESAFSQFTKLNASVSEMMTQHESGGVGLHALSQGNLRQKLFAMQSLAKLYTAQYAELSEVERSTKGLEDQLGVYRKSVEILETAKSRNESPAKIEQLSNANKQALSQLGSYIKSSGWGNVKTGQVARITEILSKIKWTSEEEEKNFSYGALSRQVDVLVKTAWDMDVLEGGRGIHDLRKQVRWVKLQMGVLSSIIGTHSTSCGQGAIHPKDPKANGKCLVSACLADRLSQSYEFFGNIKDEGEAAEGLGRHLGQEKFKEAKDYYQSLKKDAVFEKLSEEIKSCTIN
jgi:hypothetical protein